MKAVLLFLALQFGTVPAAGAGLAAREPEVTPEEARILARAAETARTSPSAAAAQLAAAAGDDAGPALEFARGVFLLQAGDDAGAEEAFRSALDRFPGFDRARADLALVLLRRERTEEAIELLRVPLLEGDPTRDQLVVLGCAYLLENRPVPAEMAYRQAVLRRPDDVEAYRGLLQALLAQRRLREAADLALLLLEKEPSTAEYWSLLARLRLAQGDPWGAIADLECARRLGASGAGELGMLGDVYRGRGLWRAAAARYREAARRGRLDDRRLLRAVEASLRSGETAAARRYFRVFLARRPPEVFPEENGERTEALRELGFSFLELRDGESLEAAAREDPLDGRVLLAAGKNRLRRGEDEAARLYFERAARNLDDPAPADAALADLAVARGNYEEAVSILKRMGEEAP